MAYYQADYLDDEYQEFWELHKRLAAKVKAVPKKVFPTRINVFTWLQRE